MRLYLELIEVLRILRSIELSVAVLAQYWSLQHNLSSEKSKFIFTNIALTCQYIGQHFALRKFKSLWAFCTTLCVNHFLIGWFLL